MVIGGNFLKSENADGFSGKATVWGSVSFHSEMFGTTYVGLVLGNFYINVVIFLYCKLDNYKFFLINF